MLASTGMDSVRAGMMRRAFYRSIAEIAISCCWQLALVVFKSVGTPPFRVAGNIWAVNAGRILCCLPRKNHLSMKRR
jgi:hypothetical protein